MCEIHISLSEGNIIATNQRLQPWSLLGSFHSQSTALKVLKVTKMPSAPQNKSHLLCESRKHGGCSRSKPLPRELSENILLVI